MNFLRASLRILTLAGLLSLSGSLPAKFTLPTIDVPANVSGAAASLAIWSSTDLTIAAGSWLTVDFPPGTTVPAPPTINTCYCLVMKFSELCLTCSAKTFTLYEVTVTAGVVNGSNSSVTFQTPAAMDIGKFYIRFRSTFGLYNPAGSGMTTLMLVDPEGNSLASRGYFIAEPLTTDVSLGTLTGKVLVNGTGNPSVGALVMASTDGIGGYHPTSFAGPMTGTPTVALYAARSVTSNSYTASTNYDGSYTMLVPQGIYTIQAFASRVTLVAGVATLQSVTSTTTATVNAVTTAASVQNLSMTAFP
jgi:hypothetical protein